MGRFELGFALLFVFACSGEAEPSDAEENPVIVDTSSEAARRQYAANLEFARSYKPRCDRRSSDRPRVLVTGFGRFLQNPSNATGLMVSDLVKSADYPITQAPPNGTVDPPGPQLSVGTVTLNVDKIGKVDVCGMILPVYWDLAATLIASELEAFAPDFVLMNGIADGTQPIWIELGSVNRALALEDGSNNLHPVEANSPIIADAAPEDEARGLLLSWDAVRAGALKEINEKANILENNIPFSEILTGARFAGFPRNRNRYLCNNTTYIVNYLMAYPKREVRLMLPSTPMDDKEAGIRTSIRKDLRKVPRVFVHWPSKLAGAQIPAGASVMKAIIGAQLLALKNGDEPTLGDNARAEIKDQQTDGGTF